MDHKSPGTELPSEAGCSIERAGIGPSLGCLAFWRRSFALQIVENKLETSLFVGIAPSVEEVVLGYRRDRHSDCGLAPAIYLCDGHRATSRVRCFRWRRIAVDG